MSNLDYYGKDFFENKVPEVISESVSYTHLDDDNGNRYPGMTQQIQGNTSHGDDTEPTGKNQSDDTYNTTNKTDDTSKPDGGESTTSKPDNTDKDDDQSKPTTDTVKDYILSLIHI